METRRRSNPIPVLRRDRPVPCIQRSSSRCALRPRGRSRRARYLDQHVAVCPSTTRRWLVIVCSSRHGWFTQFCRPDSRRRGSSAEDRSGARPGQSVYMAVYSLPAPAFSPSQPDPRAVHCRSPRRCTTIVIENHGARSQWESMSQRLPVPAALPEPVSVWCRSDQQWIWVFIAPVVCPPPPPFLF